MNAADLIKRVPMFDGIEQGSVDRLVKKLRPRLAVPGQQVHLRHGSTRLMYFIASGAVAVTLPDGSLLELGTGQMVGEISLLKRARAFQVWQEFETGQRQHEPLPSLSKSVEALEPERLVDPLPTGLESQRGLQPQGTARIIDS